MQRPPIYKVNMAQPLVGIALAAYNPNIDFFSKQLESLVAQDYSNWFCVVTCDSDLEILRNEPALKPFFQDPRFSWHQNPARLGMSKNFERGLKLCVENPDVKYICFCDHDDIWYPDKISKLVAKIQTLPPLSAAHCDMHVLMKKGEGFELLSETCWQVEKRGVHNITPLDLIIRNLPAGAAMIMDANLARKYPIIPVDCCEYDHWFALVASFHGGLYPINEPLYQYRIHGENTLGLSPFKGYFYRSEKLRQLGFLKKVTSVFADTRARVKAAREVGLPVSLRDAIIAESYWDLGLGFALKALYHLKDDPALSRACTARAIGKLMSLIPGVANQDVIS